MLPDYLKSLSSKVARLPPEVPLAPNSDLLASLARPNPDEADASRFNGLADSILQGRSNSAVPDSTIVRGADGLDAIIDWLVQWSEMGPVAWRVEAAAEKLEKAIDAYLLSRGLALLPEPPLDLTSPSPPPHMSCTSTTSDLDVLDLTASSPPPSPSPLGTTRALPVAVVAVAAPSKRRPPASTGASAPVVKRAAIEAPNGPARLALAARLANEHTTKALFQALQAEGFIRSFDSEMYTCACGTTMGLTKGTKLFVRDKWLQHWNGSKGKTSCDRHPSHPAFGQSRLSTAFFAPRSLATSAFGASSSSSARQPPPPPPNVEELAPPLAPGLPFALNHRLCPGIRSRQALHYASSLLSIGRGGFAVAEELMFQHFLFPWKSLPEPKKALTADAFRKRTQKLLKEWTVPEELRSADATLSEAERGMLKLVEDACRRWTCRDGAVYSTRCRKQRPASADMCRSCAEINVDASFKAQMNKAARKLADPEQQHRSFTFTKTSLYTGLAESTIKLIRNPRLKTAIQSSLSGPAAAFVSLAGLAEDGQLSDWTSFGELAMALQDVLTRQQDPTGNLKHGIRYSEHLINLATVLRGYGNGSAQKYNIISAALPLPTARQIARNITKVTKYEVLQLPPLCDENFEAFRRVLTRLDYDGPISLSTDCTKITARIEYAASYAPVEDGARVGGHLLGAHSLEWDEVYAATTEAYQSIYALIESKKLVSEQLRLILLTVPLPGIRPFPIGVYGADKKENAVHIASLLTKARSLAERHGVHLTTMASDSAAAERKGQYITLHDPSIPIHHHLTYQHPSLPFRISIPVYATGPLIHLPDPLHALKSLRNALYTGTRFVIVGNHCISFAMIERLYNLPNSGLYARDVYNADRQDDGAARRLFGAKTLQSIVRDDGEFEGGFKGFAALAVVFGELVDGWENVNMPHSTRAVAAFRAYFFLIAWRRDSDEREAAFSTSTRAKFYSTTSNFLACQTFNSLLSIAVQLIALLVAHREHYPRYPLLPGKCTSAPCEHDFARKRQEGDLTMASYLRSDRHHAAQAFAFASGIKIKKDASRPRTGYVEHISQVEEKLTPELFEALRSFPSSEELNNCAEVAWLEVKALFQMLGVKDLAPIPLEMAARWMRTALGGKGEGDPLAEEEEEEEEEPEDGDPHGHGLPVNLSIRHGAEVVAASIEQEQTNEYEEEEIHSQNAEVPPSLAHLLNPALPPPPPPDFVPRFSTFLSSSNTLISVPHLITHRTATDRQTKVNSELERPTLPLETPSEPLSLNHGRRLDKLKGESSLYFLRVTAFHAQRIARWKTMRARDVKPPSAPTLARISLNGQLSTSIGQVLSQELPCSTSRGVGKDRLGQELQIATGSLCAIMLDPCTPQEKPVLALAEVISLFESKTSGPHPCIPATKSLEKLSFIHVQIYGQYFNQNFFYEGEGEGEFVYYASISAAHVLYVLPDASLGKAVEVSMGARSLDSTSFERWKLIRGRRKDLEKIRIDANK